MSAPPGAASDTVANDPDIASSATGRVARAPVSAIVLTYNEERNLPDCLASLAGWVEQLFVVDSGRKE